MNLRIAALTLAVVAGKSSVASSSFDKDVVAARNLAEEM